MYVNTSGLVLRETAYKESSKILTILTGAQGKLTATARGAVRKNSKLAAATQILVFSEMTLFSSRDRWTLTEARTIEQFRGLQQDIVKLALGSYFAQLAEAVADEDSPNTELLPLCLNSLYALSEDIKEPSYVKPAFELRLLASAGFAPLISHCAVCGEPEPELSVLDMEGGTLCCAGCSRKQGAELGRGALHAARYVIGCDMKKLFSFAIGEASLRELSYAAEGYLLLQLDRRFSTLDFYKQLL